MASINKGDLITNAKFVNAFNQKIWDGILGGVVYGGQASDVRIADRVNNIQVTIKGLPHYSATRTTGVSGTGNDSQTTIVNPQVIPNGELASIVVNQDLNITLNAEEFKGKIIDAQELYNACNNCVKALVNIRPFRGTWQHDGQSAATVHFPSATGFAYGYFNKGACTGTTVYIGDTTNWNGNRSVSRWINTRGTSINITQVIMKGVSEGLVVTAADSSSNVDTLFNLWRTNCFNTNAFYYRLYTCHLNCHSRCHNRGRSRR